jgi:hypothetical protein
LTGRKDEFVVDTRCVVLLVAGFDFSIFEVRDEGSLSEVGDLGL